MSVLKSVVPVLGQTLWRQVVSWTVSWQLLTPDQVVKLLVFQMPYVFVLKVQILPQGVSKVEFDIHSMLLPWRFKSFFR